MYQKLVNELLEDDVFTLPNNVDDSCKFRTRYMRDENKYDKYINDLNKGGSMSEVLQAISYNSYDLPQVWNLPMKRLDIYREQSAGELVPSLSDGLCEKLTLEILFPFYRKIRRMIYENHMIYGDDNEPLAIQRYPLIYMPTVYFETFPIMYLHVDLSPEEVAEMAAMVDGACVLIELTDAIKVIKFNGGNGEVFVFRKDGEGLVKATLTLAVNECNRLGKLFEKLERNPSIVDELVEVLKVRVW